MQTSGSLSSVVQNMNLIYCLSPPYFRCHILKNEGHLLWFSGLLSNKKTHACSIYSCHTRDSTKKKDSLSKIYWWLKQWGYLAYRVVYEQCRHSIRVYLKKTLNYLVLMAKCACTSLKFLPMNWKHTHIHYVHTHTVVHTHKHTCTHTHHHLSYH